MLFSGLLVKQEVKFFAERGGCEVQVGGFKKKVKSYITD